jgi:hypothetical protein
VEPGQGPEKEADEFERGPPDTSPNARCRCVGEEQKEVGLEKETRKGNAGICSCTSRSGIRCLWCRGVHVCLLRLQLRLRRDGDALTPKVSTATKERWHIAVLEPRGGHDTISENKSGLSTWSFPFCLARGLVKERAQLVPG